MRPDLSTTCLASALIVTGPPGATMQTVLLDETDAALEDESGAILMAEPTQASQP
jgi:hypothetical protein